MSSVHEKYAKLRELYPEDVKKIEEEEESVRQLLQDQEYYLLESTQRVLAVARRDILTARMKLATDRRLSEEYRAELWGIVDARLWFIGLIARDYQAELDRIDADLEKELQA